MPLRTLHTTVLSLLRPSLLFNQHVYLQAAFNEAIQASLLDCRGDAEEHEQGLKRVAADLEKDLERVASTHYEAGACIMATTLDGTEHTVALAGCRTVRDLELAVAKAAKVTMCSSMIFP